MGTQWTPTTPEGFRLRAAGRRRYNALRRSQRDVRRAQVARLVTEFGGIGRGVQVRVARILGVSPSTVSRDVSAVLGDTRPCRACGAMRPSWMLDLSDRAT